MARRLPVIGAASTAALVVFVASSVALQFSHHATLLPLPRKVAVQAVLHDHRSATTLRALRWTRAEVTPIDPHLEQVIFYRGGRVVFDAALRPDGTIKQAIVTAELQVPYGSPLAYRPAVLIGLTLLFVLMAGVVPLWRMRNLDVAVLVSLGVAVVLFQHHLVGASMLVATAALGYLALRCAWTALGGNRATAPSTPLYSRVTNRWTEHQRRRMLRLLLVAAALAFLMVGVSSPSVVDVIYAVMEGATNLVHGLLPYGHLPGDVIHGDTYPILGYALYAPIALLAPVGSTWDSVDLALASGALAALLAGVAVYFATVGGGLRAARPPSVEIAGLRGALAWLCFPPLLVTVSTGTTDVVLAAMLVWAVLLWRRPAASSALIGLAGWFKLAPFALLPIWLAPLRGRRLLRSLAALTAVSAASVGLVVALGGIAGLRAMVDGIGYQFSRGAFQSVWHTLGVDALQPFGEASVLAFLAGAAVRLRRDPGLAGDPRRIAALAAVVLIGLQLSADYWAFLYLAWIGPFVLMALVTDPQAIPASILATATPPTASEVTRARTDPVGELVGVSPSPSTR